MALIRPLFLMRAKVDDDVPYPDPNGHVKVNCWLLRDQGLEPSLVQVPAQKLADPALPFTEKLSAIAKRPDLDEERFIPRKLEKGYGFRARLLVNDCRTADDSFGDLYDLYDERIAFYLENPAGQDWNGVFVATSK